MDCIPRWYLLESDGSGFSFWLFHLPAVWPPRASLTTLESFIFKCEKTNTYFTEPLWGINLTMLIQCSARCLGTTQVLNKDFPLFRELIPYLHNCNSMIFFPALGYNLSPLLWSLVLCGATENKANPSIILQTFRNIIPLTKSITLLRSR